MKSIGRGLMLFGTGLWLVGYLTTGTPPLVDWETHTPQWFAAFLPNIESEIGFALMLVAVVPTYWPAKSHAGKNGGEPR